MDQRYKLADREYRVRVTEQSSLVGRTLDEVDLRGTAGVNLVAIERQRRRTREVFRPTPKTELAAGDVLLVDLFRPTADIDALRQRLGLEALP